VVLAAYIKSISIKQSCSTRVCCVNDSFGESGTPAQLMEKGMNNKQLLEAVKSYQKKIIYFLKAIKNPSRYIT
jgi:hypothetical protein